MSHSRRSFGRIAALALGAAALPLPLWASVEDQPQVLADVEAYLNTITTLDARFVQLNQDGSTATGQFQLKRPLYARIAYDDPPTILVARGQKYQFWDAEIGQFYEGPVSASPASVLLYPDIKLDEVATVLDVRRDKGQLMVTLRPSEDPGSGLLTLVFEENPMRLRQWYVKDAQGAVTRVTLMDSAFGVEIDNEIFEIDHQSLIRPSTNP
jgi:outer membrane lipoprotein-sorting protein